jgi:CheY-like chemotaxis protein
VARAFPGDRLKSLSSKRFGNYLGHFVAQEPDVTITTAMPLESLLVSRDPQVVSILRQTLDKFSIELEVCEGASSGKEILSSEKFDAIVVDCDDLQGGLDMLEGLRQGQTNKTSIKFAILNGVTTTQKAFELGANFVMQKPISALNSMRCFTAALGLMERERRRYFRLPIEMAVLMIFGEGQEFKVATTNLSEGGMAITFRGKLPQSRLSRIVFSLPGGEAVTECKAQVAWVDGGGRAGVRFLDMAPNPKQKLGTWLEEQMKRQEL